MTSEYGNPTPEWLQIDWSRHLRAVDLPGSRLCFVEIGEGPPLLFVHGMSGRWQNWLENLPHFARSHRAIALDLPGFGNSPEPSWEVSIPRYGRLLLEFCERLGIDRCAAIGNSMGGFIATEAALEEPARFDRLCLVAPAGITFAETTPEQVERFTRLVRASYPLMSRLRRGGLGRVRARRMGFSASYRHPELLRPELLYEQLEPEGGSPGFERAMRALAGYDARDRLAELDLPVLLVWGRDDRLVPVAAADDYARRIPSARLEIFDDTGHVPQLERPARFNRLLEEFLSAT